MEQSNRTIGVRHLKAHTSAVLRDVQMTGAAFIITVHGRPIARIEPLTEESEAGSVDGMGSSRGALAELSKLRWDDFEAAKKLWEPRLANGE